MNWIKLAIAALIFAAGVAAGVKVHSGLIAQRDLAAQESADKERTRLLDRSDVAAAGHEADKTKIQTQFLTITKEVERVVEKPVYSNICFDDDGLRVITTAINGLEATGQPAPTLPEPAGTE